MRLLHLAAFLTIAITLPAQTPATPATPQDARNTILSTNSPVPLPQFNSIAVWQQRRAFLRNQILVAAGLSPMPVRSPLNPQVFGKISGKGYTVEKVLIETFPGFYLGGNLYRPTNGNARHPAVLTPHGHWPYGRLENTTIFSGPSLGISLARQGYVVFAYDMVGYNDTLQLPHRFGSPTQQLWSFGPLGIQLWDSIRALDFLASLPDVDPAHIGITGASGGGTQTILLAAVDDRLAFAAPANMVSAIMQGGDLCENAPGLRIHTSNVEFAAIFAPKPMLLLSATGDWTRNVPSEEFPAIRKLYTLFGQPQNIGVFQSDAPHNFNQAEREAVYRFFSEVNPGLTPPAELKEHDITAPMLQDMLALSNHTLPADALSPDGIYRQWQQLTHPTTLPDADLRLLLRQTLSVQIPAHVESTTLVAPGSHHLSPHSLSHEAFSSLTTPHGQALTLSRPGFGDRVPAVFIEGSGPVAIVVDPLGTTAALTSDIVRQLHRQHRPILIVNAFATGADTAAPIHRGTSSTTEDSANLMDANSPASPLYLAYNVSDDAARVQDIVTAIVYASAIAPHPDLYARGDAALWSTFAVAVSTAPVSLHIADMPSLTTDTNYLAHFNVPGILRAGGLPAAQHLLPSQ